jgi:uroporphyrinogen decarboxylase
LIKQKQDIDVIGEFATAPKCDVAEVNRAAEEMGERGIVRGHICCFDVFGQPGCWQDACCLAGTEAMILATHDDPQWVHEFLKILQRRKRVFVRSLKGARYDILELGGGDASSTVISPRIFDRFVAPYDCELIEEAHRAGQRIVYHTCGGMMPLLERIAGMNPDAMETFTPRGMGGDTDLAEAKRRIGARVCMIGGFDQFHFLKGCTPEDTRREVRRCFEEAGAGGGYILSPSDHFFEADLPLLEAFAGEARNACTDGACAASAAATGVALATGLLVETVYSADETSPSRKARLAQRYAQNYYSRRCAQRPCCLGRGGVQNHLAHRDSSWLCAGARFRCSR